jgi:hypothetical protein
MGAMFFRTLAGAVILAWAAPAFAQQPVALQFEEGRVTLVARNVPVRAILGEWARLGGATIVNGDQIGGAPVTMELTAVPEREAIAVILRDVAGYLLAPRPAGSKGVSAFNRIVILPTSAPPRTPQPAAPAAAQRPGFQRPPIAIRPPVVEQAEMPPDDPVEPEEPQAGAPPAGAPRAAAPRPLRLPFGTPGSNGSNVRIVSDDDDPNSSTPSSEPAGRPPSAANPFGMPAGSSSMPGTIAPAPPAQQQRPEANPVQ